MEEADLTKAVRVAVDGAFSNSGQRCTSIKRVVVREEVADTFVEAFTEEVKRLRWGDPLDAEVQVGCLIDEEAARKVEERIQGASGKGAVFCCGGRREGALLSPAVLDHVSPKSEIVCSETFGPTAPVLRVKSDEEPVTLTNSTPYGLQSGIMTRDWERALKLAGQLRVGGVVINEGPGFGVEFFPFGGVKKSGVGKEGIRYAVEAMCHNKLVVV